MGRFSATPFSSMCSWAWCLLIVKLSVAVVTLPLTQILAAEEGSCSDASCAGHVSMLQRAHKTLGENRMATSQQTPIGKTAITFAGGGFLSVADFTASIIGFAGKSGDLMQLFKKFDLIVGTSGGSWFWNMLVYSPSFQTMVETCALNHDSAGTLYNTNFQINWLTNFKQRAQGDNIFQCLKLKGDAHVLMNQSTFKMPGKSSTESSSENDVTWAQTLQGLDLALEQLPAQLNEQRQTGERNVRQLRRTFFPDLSSLLKGLPAQLSAEYADVVYNMLVSSDGLHWTNLVDHILLAGAGISQTLPMGTDKVNAWAKGKVGMMTSTAITPSALGKNNMNWYAKNYQQVGPPNVTIYNTSGNLLTYTAKEGTYNFAQPVRFSVVLGGGEDQDSAMPFCSSTECQTYQATYTLEGETLGTQNLASRFKNAFETKAGKIPVAGASAASSAAAGMFLLRHPIANQDCATLAVWSSNAENGKSFTSASWERDFLFNAPDINYQKYLAQQVETNSLMPLVDGGESDDTAVATAVAAGASEVLTFQDSSDSKWSASNPMQLASLFRGSPTPGTVIFEKPAFDEFIDLYNRFSEIHPAAKDTQFLKKIVYGSVQCVTQRSDFFGIEAGRKVKLNVWAPEVLNITMGIPAAGFAGVFSYGTLVQEIVTTLRTSPQTQQILDQFF